VSLNGLLIVTQE